MSTAENAAQPKKVGAFTAKYGDDAFHKEEWGDETSQALRDAGFKIVKFGPPTNMLYVGQTNAQNAPHGQGYLYQTSGDRHEGQFANGRAHGVGAYFGANGKQWKGTWDQNKRIGTFAVVCPKGVKWTEKYSLEGARKSRTKDRVEEPNPEWREGKVDEDGKPVPEMKKVLVPPAEPAKQCWQCDCFGREDSNHAWSCRSHTGSWAYSQTYQGDGEAPGVWSCCGSENKDEAGCSFSECNYRS